MASAGIAERLQSLFDYAFAGAPQYFELPEWAGFEQISQQIEVYETSGLAGAIAGGGGIGFAFLALAAIGAVILARDRTVPSGERLLLMFWIGGATVVITLTSPLPWARYYLPLAPAVILLVAYALSYFGGRALAWAADSPSPKSRR